MLILSVRSYLYKMGFLIDLKTKHYLEGKIKFHGTDEKLYVRYCDLSGKSLVVDFLF